MRINIGIPIFTLPLSLSPSVQSVPSGRKEGRYRYARCPASKKQASYPYYDCDYKVNMGATHFNMLVGLITSFSAFNVMLVHAGGPAKNPFSELAAIDNKYFAPKACPIGTAMSMKGGVRHCVKCPKVCIKLLCFSAHMVPLSFRVATAKVVPK
jgi:hypothetical protein